MNVFCLFYYLNKKEMTNRKKKRLRYQQIRRAPSRTIKGIVPNTEYVCLFVCLLSIHYFGLFPEDE